MGEDAALVGATLHILITACGTSHRGVLVDGAHSASRPLTPAVHQVPSPALGGAGGEMNSTQSLSSVLPKAEVPNIWACQDLGCTAGDELERNVLQSSRNHPPTPGLWKNCLPRNQSLVPKRLGTAAPKDRTGFSDMRDFNQ